MTFSKRAVAGAVCALMLGWADSPASTDAQTGPTARAELKDATNQTVGQADLTGTPNGVLIRLRLTSAPSGVHAFHIHEIGKCDAPSFESAGGHYNPTNAQHGFLSAKGAHLGDLPNVHIPQGGALVTEVLIDEVSLSAAGSTLLDADGAALMLHAAADDYRTDPSGSAGDRVACGVITK